METRQLAGTDVRTTVLGFGCAGLSRLPTRRERHAVLEAAREAGIRHFDVAPMYGLGRAEAELAPLLADDRDAVTVTTKFGIEPTASGRLAGRAQTPVRALLSRRPRLQAGVAASGRDPASGMVGRLLYRGAATATTAERSLQRSLRELGVGYIDVYAVHEPRLVEPEAGEAIADRLDELRRAGRIRAWGLAGRVADPDGPLARLVAGAQVVQQRDDVLDPLPAPGGARITYGALSRALPLLASYLRRRDLTGEWSERLQVDIGDPASLAGPLLRQAARRNASGVVLFSTTRPQRVHAAVAALTHPGVDGEEQAIEAFAAVAGASEPLAGPR